MLEEVGDEVSPLPRRPDDDVGAQPFGPREIRVKRPAVGAMLAAEFARRVRLLR